MQKLFHTIQSISNEKRPFDDTFYHVEQPNTQKDHVIATDGPAAYANKYIAVNIFFKTGGDIFEEFLTHYERYQRS